MTALDPLWEVLLLAVHERWRDVAGRPLGEAAAPDLYAAAGVDEGPCPWPGHRRGRPMNLAALREVQGHRDEVMRLLRGLVRVRGHTCGDALWATTAALLAPLRCDPDALPVPIAALHKTCLGWHKLWVALLLAEPELCRAPVADLGSDEALLAFLDDGGWLVGERLVCAGSPEALVATFRALAGDEGPADPPAPELIALADEGLARLACAAAWLAATRAALASGDVRHADLVRSDLLGHRVLRDPRPPWAQVVLAVAREPEHARRLVAAPCPPLERLLPALAAATSQEARDRALLESGP